MTLLLIDDGGATEIAAAAIVVIGGHSNDEIEDGSEVTNRDDLHDITLLLGNGMVKKTINISSKKR